MVGETSPMSFQCGSVASRHGSREGLGRTDLASGPKSPLRQERQAGARRLDIHSRPRHLLLGKVHHGHEEVAPRHTGQVPGRPVAVVEIDGATAHVSGEPLKTSPPVFGVRGHGAKMPIQHAPSQNRFGKRPQGMKTSRDRTAACQRLESVERHRARQMKHER